MDTIRLQLLYRRDDLKARLRLNDLGYSLLPPPGQDWPSLRQEVGCHLLLHAELYLRDRAAYTNNRRKVIEDYWDAVEPGLPVQWVNLDALFEGS
jgi:hypothetical protein